MTNQKRRLDRLIEAQSARQDVTIIATVPGTWCERRRREWTDATAASQGIPQPFDSWLIEDQTAKDARLEFAGNLSALLAQVAAGGRRIGVDDRRSETGNQKAAGLRTQGTAQ